MGGVVLYVANSAQYFLSHRLALAKGARALGFDVHVAAPQAENLSPIRREGFVVHPFPYLRGNLSPLREAGTLGALVRLYRATRPRLVHHLTLKPVLFGTVAARIAGVPAVVNAVNGLGHLFVEGNWYRRTLREAFKAVGRVAFQHGRMKFLFQNVEDMDVFIQARLAVAGDSVLIRGSGVDLTAFKRASEPDGVPVVLLASRMLWHKGIGVFVDAARRLRQAGVTARFVLVGEPDTGNPESVDRSQLEEWNREGVVEWWGHRSDMPSTLGGCHVVTLPTYYREGVPKVLIEAAACGRPLVATDMPGCRDIVREGVNGILVPPRDPVALAAALGELLADPGLRMAYGECGRDLVQREFSIERVVGQTLGVYRELLGLSPSPGEAAS